MWQDNRLLHWHCWLGSYTKGNRRKPPLPQAVSSASVLSPDLTRSSGRQGTQRLLCRPEGPPAARRAISSRREADEVALTRVRSSARPPPRLPPRFPSQCQRDIPSWDTGCLSCSYNTLFYPEPSFEMLRGAQQEEASRLRSKASLTHICAGVCVFLGLCIKRLPSIIPSIDLCLVPLAAC